MLRSHYSYTRSWLEDRYTWTTDDGVFLGHMPIYGHASQSSEPGRLPRLARAVQVLRVLERVPFETVLDVGGAEGWLAWTIARHFGARTVSSDLSIEACRRSVELFEQPAVACDAELLPFADDSFDVVTCTEVIEHVEHPIQLLFELQRVAKRAVIVSTEEITDSRDRVDWFLKRRCGLPHSERNKFVLDDFRAVLGGDCEFRPQFRLKRPKEPMPDPEARQWLLNALSDLDGLEGGGVVVLHPAEGTEAIEPKSTPEQWVDRVLDSVIPARPAEPIGAELADRVRSTLEDVLVDPWTHEPLRVETSTAHELRGSDGRRFDLRDGCVPEVHVRDGSLLPRASLDAEIDRRIPDPDRREAVRTLASTLSLPDTTGQTEWLLNDPGQRRGFALSDEIEDADESPASNDTGWRLRSTGGDPFLIGPTMPWSTDRLSAVEIDLVCRNPEYPVDAATGQLFWHTTESKTFDETDSVRFPVRNDGLVHRYRVELKGLPQWPAGKDLVCLRFDPVDGPADLQLIRIGLVVEPEKPAD